MYITKLKITPVIPHPLSQDYERGVPQQTGNIKKLEINKKKISKLKVVSQTKFKFTVSYSIKHDCSHGINQLN